MSDPKMFDCLTSPVPGVRWLPVHYWDEQKAWRVIVVGGDGIYRCVYFYAETHGGIEAARHAAELFAVRRDRALSCLYIQGSLNFKRLPN